MTVRVGIDARDIFLEHPTGVERVMYHFVEALHRQGHPTQEYVLFVSEPPRPGRLDDLPGELVVIPERYPRLQRVADLWIALQMRAAMKEHRIDAFVSLNTKFPFTSRPCFTTVHGLEWSFCSEEYRRLERMKQWMWFQLCSRFSAGIVTFAQHTLEDIRKLRPRCALPIRVVPEGVSADFRKHSESELDASVLSRLGVRRPYVLSVCSHEPRKNLDALIRAFARVRAEHDVPHQLVLPGRSGWKSERLRALVAAQSLQDRVVLPGYVSDADLVQLYGQAELFAYPSKYEGFGLPPLEAMACGIPVLTSNCSSTKEVAGDAAILIDPYDEADLAAGLARGLLDEECRRRLAVAGLARARAFSWDEMTRRICQFVAEQTEARAVPAGAGELRSGSVRLR